jgi:hypothetical protein
MWAGIDDMFTGPVDEIIVVGVLSIIGAVSIYNSDANKNFSDALAEAFTYNFNKLKDLFTNDEKKSGENSAAAPSPLLPDPDDEENLEYESNPKHHQNARGNASQEPKNAKEMFEKSVKDPTKDGTRWYKDKNGTLHRFMEHEKNKYHWNGSFSGKPSQLNGNVQKLYRCLPKGDI